VTPFLVTARCSRRPGQRKAATTNRIVDYTNLERESITATMSPRAVTSPRRLDLEVIEELTRLTFGGMREEDAEQ
jgi:hypothetical protein